MSHPERCVPRRPRLRGALAVVALLVVTPAAGLAAQQSPPPNPLGQPPLDASGRLREDAFIHIPLRPEDERYGDIEGRRLKVAAGRAGDHIGHTVGVHVACGLDAQAELITGLAVGCPQEGTPVRPEYA